MKKQIISCCHVAIITLILVSMSFDGVGQKRTGNEELSRIDVQNTTLRVIVSKFNSDETTRATSDYKTSLANNKDPRKAIFSLKQKGYSLPTIMATVRKNFSGTTSPSSTTTVTNINIADDVQLMLKSISGLTAADLLASVQTLYDVTDVDLFNIAVIAMQDSVERVTQTRYFTFKCDCKLDDQYLHTSMPRYASKSMSFYDIPYKRRLYAWECYDYWNTGLRNLLLSARGLNGYLTALKKSQYPLYKGMMLEDLNVASINFKTIFGNPGDSLYRLFECVALNYQNLASTTCPSEMPYSTSKSYHESQYSGTAYFPYSIRPMCRLGDVLPILKRNGYTITEITTAIKRRFSPDEYKKQKIVESFDKTIFTNTELLEVARVLNQN